MYLDILDKRTAASSPAAASTAIRGCRLWPFLWCLWCLAPLLASSTAWSQPALSPDHPRTYTVQPGDTLWDIAGRFLRDPWLWPQVWQANNTAVGNPNLIYPGDVLELSYDSAGNPRVRGTRGGMRVVKLSPRVRVTELDQAIPTIPVDAIAPFLTRPLVADSREIDEAPYVVGFPEGQMLAGVGDTFYVRSIFDPSGNRYEILRPGQEYRDPDTGEVLGFEAAFVAEARLERAGDPATLTVTRSAMEVAIADRAHPARETHPIRSFLPNPAPPGLEGKIIAVLGGVSQIGQYDVVVLNRGQRDGVDIGHVFEAYRGGNQRRDPVRTRQTEWNWRNETPLDTSFWLGDWELTGWRRDEPDENAPLPLHRQAERMNDTYIVPDSRAGVVMVFRVFPRVSFALVMYARQAMHIGDAMASPRES